MFAQRPGAFANRVTFKAYFLFLTTWLVLVYFPFVHMVWSSDGILAKCGVLGLRRRHRCSQYGRLRRPRLRAIRGATTSP
ncbi:hypothetical protein [Paraburkholderia sp. DGU8]|uniref:hypothetical protein n=1 Tax=Paraburkholderia sp. DGU8 TaxID=3161997 RepID=UPI003466D690